MKLSQQYDHHKVSIGVYPTSDIQYWRKVLYFFIIRIRDHSVPALRVPSAILGEVVDVDVVVILRISRIDVHQ